MKVEARLDRSKPAPGHSSDRAAAGGRTDRGGSPAAREAAALAGALRGGERIAPSPPQSPRPRPGLGQPRRAGASRRDFAAWRIALGGRVLAWLAVSPSARRDLPLASPISHGWIGPVARTLIAGLASRCLIAAGIRLHGRHGRTDAALAAVSTAVWLALFATVTVAAQVYHLVPSFAGLLLAAPPPSAPWPPRWRSGGSRAAWRRSASAARCSRRCSWAAWRAAAAVAAAVRGHRVGGRRAALAALDLAGARRRFAIATPQWVGVPRARRAAGRGRRSPCSSRFGALDGRRPRSASRSARAPRRCAHRVDPAAGAQRARARRSSGVGRARSTLARPSGSCGARGSPTSARRRRRPPARPASRTTLGARGAGARRRARRRRGRAARSTACRCVVGWAAGGARVRRASPAPAAPGHRRRRGARRPRRPPGCSRSRSALLDAPPDDDRRRGATIVAVQLALAVVAAGCFVSGRLAADGPHHAARSLLDADRARARSPT